MRKLFIILSLAAFSFAKAPAQFTSFGNFPVDLEHQEIRFAGGVAIAEHNVIIRYRDTTIFCDYAEYNEDTRDVLVRGNVRIYRDGHTFVGDRAVYNLETKQLRAANFRGDAFPFHFSAESLTTFGPSEYSLRDATLTTSDSAQPDYFLRAKNVRIYSKDHMVFSNVALYIGKTPVFWWPYLYQSLDQKSSFTLAPGYRSKWGAFLLYAQSFPITDEITGRLKLDYYSNRGPAAGLEAEYKSKGGKDSWAKLRTYLIDDSSPSYYNLDTLQPNSTKKQRVNIDSIRYRVSLQSRVYITEDLYSTINVNKLSDPNLMRDFMPGEYRLDPQPDNVVALTKLNDDFTLTGIARDQLNTFFETTERLPEFTFDMKRTALFNSPVFYEGETGYARLNHNFPEGSTFPDYNTNRVDSFHQFTLPMLLGKWLSIIPRVGFRGTYYSSTGSTDSAAVSTPIVTLNPDGSQTQTTGTTTVHNLITGGPAVRGVFNTGLEASFKASREWNDFQSRALGLDGLRHIIQPYTDLSYVYSSKDPNNILQFDRVLKSDQLPDFTFPQFTGVDSISSWAILRTGVRNRLQTRRDDETINWLQLDTFFDVNMKKPTFPGFDVQEGSLSNLYNRLTFNPVPWMNVRLDTQVPLTSSGFWEANTSTNFLVSKDLQLSVGHRYLSGNPFFTNSSLVTFEGYYKINENWGVSATEEYEFKDHVLQWQTYQIHRDLSSWIASFGLSVRDNNPNATEYALLLTFTLKAFPIINLPLNFDPSTSFNP